MKKASPKILHLLPHAGGGVGTVLRAFLQNEIEINSIYEHSLVFLEELNEITKVFCDTFKIRWIDQIAIKNKWDELYTIMSDADIVFLHWWNHPLLAKLFYKGFPKTRLLIWAHVNGLYAPQKFVPLIFQNTDIFILSTPASFEAPIFITLDKEINKKIEVIQSCAGVPKEALTFVKKQSCFRMGYVGTVDFIKMHQDFLTMCAAANIPASCIVAGGPEHKKLEIKAKQLGISNLFKIIGPVKNPHPIYKNINLFVYPLNPFHYGTGEQVIIEAMSYGAVPIVLNNPPERVIVKNNITGVVANNNYDFTEAIRLLYHDQATLNKLSNHARQFVLEECQISKYLKKFHLIFDKLMSIPKTSKYLEIPPIDGVKEGSPMHLFLYFCGEKSILEIVSSIMSNNKGGTDIPSWFFAQTRGSPLHYYNMLEEDKMLEKLIHKLQLN